LAAWGHSPLANEIEQHVVRQLAGRFGYDPEHAAGSFASGGAEANHTGLLTALSHVFPSWSRHGARGLPGQPVLYISEESHHSFAKAARMSGLGDESVTLVPLDQRYVMDVAALADSIHRDRSAGKAPFLVVATMGTTNAGLLDPVDRIAEVTDAESLWLHADAAWGGAAALVPELRSCLGAIERADSITFDAHKWLSVPMGAGMFFTRHPDILEQTFGVDTQYMPLTGEHVIIEPHRTTMQWSRRFIGLKLFLSLLVAGWEGYEQALRHQNDLGNLLRETPHRLLERCPRRGRQFPGAPRHYRSADQRQRQGLDLDHTDRWDCARTAGDDYELSHAVGGSRGTGDGFGIGEGRAVGRSSCRAAVEQLGISDARICA
jgi:glutamate/tyrosine decarboxylase-like PLP-dependent enzyme